MSPRFFPWLIYTGPLGLRDAGVSSNGEVKRYTGASMAT